MPISLPSAIFIGTSLPVSFMYPLTLQLHTDAKWHDVMSLSFTRPELGLEGPCSFSYDQNYVLNALDNVDSRLDRAVSACLPVSWEYWQTPQAPAFLFDILPAGAARRFLLKRLGGERPKGLSLDLFLLGRCTPAPIGNLRIKEAAQALAGSPLIGFTRDEVINRDARFLEFAYEQGAAIGGATGAGGEAPKLLLIEDANGALHPDAVLPDAEAVRHWFVKFARNKGGQTDQEILQSEFCYYRAVQKLGLDTVAADGLALEQGRKPSLWMRRFDREVTPSGVNRVAVESLYSLAGVTEPGAYMRHTEVLRYLVELWRDVGQAGQVSELVFEYLRRELLNQVLGNSDNHGRNTSILRTATGLKLAPIYDLAPMVMDDEGVTRTTKWPQPIEIAGEVNWRLACKAAEEWTDPEWLFEQLRASAQSFLALPDLLAEEGLPANTMNHPRIALRSLAQRLNRWGLT